VIPGVILAAGASSRMGRSKALLPIGGAGECFVTRIVRTLADAGVEHTIVVVRPDDTEVCDVLEREGLHADVLANPSPDRGQLSSLQVALATLGRPGVVAALITLVDIPLVSAGTVSSLLAAWRRSHAPVVRPSYRGRRGHPYIIGRDVFAEMLHAPVESGARPVLARYEDRMVHVEVEDAGILLDVDTPAEFARLSVDPRL
jgi:CTP:molybdopterin cytidylyltransferase MocA